MDQSQKNNITSEETEINEIPVSITIPRESNSPSGEEGGMKGFPVVLAYHGFTSCKETLDDLGLISGLVERGFACVSVDAVGHGRRKDNSIETMDEPWKTFALFDIVNKSAEEIGKLLDGLSGNPRLDVSRVAVTGISMGGFIAFAAAGLHERIGLVAAIIGCPCFEEFLMHELRNRGISPSDFTSAIENVRKMDPCDKLPSFVPRPMMILNGTHDTDVPSQFSQGFYDMMQPHYSHRADLLQLKLYETDHWHIEMMIPDAVDFISRNFK